MLIKLNINRLKDRQSEMEAIASKMDALNKVRVSKLIAINEDQDHTPAWKSTASEKLKQSPELAALDAQMRLLVAVIEEQKGLWRDSAGLLRDAAVPRRDQMGVDAYTTAMAELGFLLNEAAALSQNPAALQAALDSAVLREDWRAVYALTVGRIDPLGRALPSANGLYGTPLAVLPLPGRDESEEIFYGCEIAKLRRDAVMDSVNSGDTRPTDFGTLTTRTKLLAAKRDYEDTVKQRDRLRSKLSALERFELQKDGAPEQPTFDEQVKAAMARAKQTGLDDTEAPVPED